MLSILIAINEKQALRNEWCDLCMISNIITNTILKLDKMPFTDTSIRTLVHLIFNWRVSNVIMCDNITCRRHVICCLSMPRPTKNPALLFAARRQPSLIWTNRNNPHTDTYKTWRMFHRKAPLDLFIGARFYCLNQMLQLYIVKII